MSSVQATGKRTSFDTFLEGLFDSELGNICLRLWLQFEVHVASNFVFLGLWARFWTSVLELVLQERETVSLRFQDDLGPQVSIADPPKGVSDSVRQII